jgi:hypothetical protein
MRRPANRLAVAGAVHALLTACAGCSLIESFDGYTDGGDAYGHDGGDTGSADGPSESSMRDAPFIPIRDTGARDTGGAKVDSTTGTDAAPMTCPDDTVFTPIPWSPPSMFFQGACTQAETAAYVTSFNSPNPTTSGSASCDACIQTDYGDAEHGPIITAVINGMTTPIEINYGGCLADLDGEKGPGSCGNVLNNGNDCADQECGDCSDFSNPQMGGATQMCLNTVRGGACAGLELTTACHNETQAANVQQICLGPLQVLLDQWCGPPPDSGAPPEAGGGDGPTEQ